MSISRVAFDLESNLHVYAKHDYCMLGNFIFLIYRMFVCDIKFTVVNKK